jgi:hypothetical protein
MSEEDAKEQTDFVLVGRESAPEVYAEGWTHVYFGYPLMKVVFHTVLEPKGGETKKEVRRAVAVVAMPLVTGMQLAHTLISAFKANSRILGGLTDQEAQKVKQILAQLPVAADPAPGKEEKTQ